MTDRPVLSSSPTSPAYEALIKRAQVDLLGQFLAYWRGALSALAVVTVVTYLAGRSSATPTASTVWFTLAFSNCCAQASVCRAMELSGSPELAMRRWHVWLLASIGINGVIWGSVPWLVMDAGLEAVWFAALLDLMLLFCIGSSPGTWQMIHVATLSMAVLATAALLRKGSYPVWAAGYAGLILLVGFYGLRLNKSRVQGLIQRFAAEDLAIELEAKQAKLEQQQAQLIEVERERTLLLERQRLMRDMHDGLGASLVSSLAAAKRGDVNPDELASLLADCVDDLRAVIDSLEPGDHDLATLLGSMRNRLDRRIQGADMQLEWKIDDLPSLPWMGPTEALQVMRIVQEAVTNSIKHSSAMHIGIAAQLRDSCVELRIADDGIGFDVDATSRGRGLDFLRHRANALGARVELQSSPAEGTSVILILPINPGNPAVRRESVVTPLRAEQLRVRRTQVADDPLA